MSSRSLHGANPRIRTLWARYFLIFLDGAGQRTLLRVGSTLRFTVIHSLYLSFNVNSPVFSGVWKTWKAWKSQRILPGQDIFHTFVAFAPSLILHIAIYSLGMLKIAGKDRKKSWNC